MESRIPLPEVSASPDANIKELSLKVALLELKPENTVELLHVWRNRAFAYQKVLKVDGIRAESVDH